MALALAWPLRAGGAELGAVRIRRDRGGLAVAFRLEGLFTPEMEERIDSGSEVSFEFTVRLRRSRSGFLDKTVAERYVTVSARYNNLTRMYRVSRQIDGTVTGADVTDDRSAVSRWLAEVEDVRLFDARDLAESGRYYIKVRAKLQSRVKALVIPWDLETSWSESEKVDIAVEKQ